MIFEQYDLFWHRISKYFSLENLKYFGPKWAVFLQRHVLQRAQRETLATLIFKFKIRKFENMQNILNDFVSTGTHKPDNFQ